MTLEQAGLQFIAQDVNKYIGDLNSAANAEAATGDASAAAAQKVAKHSQAIDDLTSKVGLQKKQFDILTQELLKANDTYGAGSIQAQKKDLALQGLAQSIVKNERALQGEEQALVQEKAALAATIAADNEAAQAADKLGTEVQQTAKEVEKSGSSFSAWGEIVKGALHAIGQFAVQELGQAARAVGGFVKDSIGLAGDFQANMLNFQSVAGRSVDTKGLEQFRSLFLQLGKELPVSTADVQQAAIEMVKGGIDPATVAAGGLKQNIQFAAAAMEGDLVGAAEVSAKILGGWAEAGATAAEKADFLTHATDQLTKAANASSVDVKELALGIFNSQGIAKAAGVSFDDLTTTLAELAPRFASSSEAGTSLKNMIVRLNPTTKSAAGAMEGLGLYTEGTGSAFYDAQGNFVGFQKASELLKQSLVGLTKEQQSMALQTIFGNDAMSAASALAELGSQGYTDMAAALTNANGVQAAAALKQQGYNTALDNAKGSVEALQITIGTALLPVLTDLLNNAIAPGVNAFTDLAAALGGDEEAGQRLSPTMLEIGKIILALSTDVQNVVGAFNDAGAASSDFASSIGDLASDLGLPGQLITQMVNAVQDLIGAFQGGGSATSELNSVLTTVTGNWQAIFATIGEYIPGILTSIATITQSVMEQISTFWAENGNEVMATVNMVLKTIGDIYNTTLQIVLALVGNKLSQMAQTFETYHDQIHQIINGAWNVISGIVIAGLALIQGAVHITLDLINGDWGKAWADLQSASAAFVTGLQKVIVGFLDSIAALFGTSLDKIGALWQHNWDALIDIANKVGDKMVDAGRDMIQGIIKGITNESGKLYSALTNMAQNAIDKFYKAIGAASPATEFIPAGQYAIQGIAVGLMNAAPGLYGLIGQIANQLVLNAGKKMTDAIREQNTRITDALNQTVKDIQAKIGTFNISILTSGADLNRQKAANIAALDELGAKAKSVAQQQLDEAAKIAATLNDPQQQADYFKARSDAILEMAKLQDTLNKQLTASQRTDLEQSMARIKARMDETTNDVEKQSLQQLLNRQQATLDASTLTPSQIAALQQQIGLINAAQQQEGQAQSATMAQGSSVTDLAGQINDVLSQLQSVQNSPITIFDDTVKQLRALLDKLTQPSAQPMAAGQFAAAGTVASYTNNRTVNMPIYTNQSPAVIQQSAAILSAALP